MDLVLPLLASTFFLAGLLLFFQGWGDR